MLHLTGFFITGSARPITGGAPQGVYGVQLVGEPFPNASVEIMTFDGSGGVTVSILGPGDLHLEFRRQRRHYRNPAYNASTIYLLRTSGGAGGADVVSGIGHLQ